MFQKILVLGGGLSAHYLLDYLHTKAPIHNWQIGLADQSEALLVQKKNEFPLFKIHLLDIMQSEDILKLLREYEVVVSLLPAVFQPIVAKYCLQMQCHLLTASYLPPEIKALEAKVKAKNLFFLNEAGLDPGLDHLSACAFINAIKQENGEITAFRSFAGALVAPESEDNLWNYKFTWNPQNVVKAGQSGMAQFLKNGKTQYIPYWQLFKRTQAVEIEGLGSFEAYPNRDSLKYQSAYGLDQIETIERGTLRRVGFTKAWDLLVQIGLTDDDLVLKDLSQSTYQDFTTSFIKINKDKDATQNLVEYLNISPEDESFQKILWLGLLEDEKIGLEKVTPAQVLLHRLHQKWALQPEDKDMVVMQHQIEYIKDKKKYRKVVDLVVKGENAQRTAIAKTVGLTLAMATELLMQGKIHLRGVFIPTAPSLYVPILAELSKYEINFKEKTEELGMN
jgi:saccharopine dehydrogenase (NADP+, L-glutamate forming)